MTEKTFLTNYAPMTVEEVKEYIPFIELYKVSEVARSKNVSRTK